MATSIGPASGLAERYAGALYELADEAKTLDQVADDLRSLKALYEESADFRRLIRSPVLGWEDQERALAAIAERYGAQRLTSNFLRLVARNRRLFALPEMADAFLAILAERRGEVRAKITAARPLSDEQMKRLETALRDVAGAKVTLETAVDSSLLGGMVVQLGSRMYDSSLRTKLQRLQHAMKGVH
ncbi:MAG TPA: F0F1 ATP synthase subunit delta [Alphaproteobacteria bacterium]|nr:F0F1 ATP synthase subunit delta [Alphaproteobacteria bacterium]